MQALPTPGIPVPGEGTLFFLSCVSSSAGALDDTEGRKWVFCPIRPSQALRGGLSRGFLPGERPSKLYVALAAQTV